MPRVFISYKRADKNKVFPLKDKIEAAIGEPCWIDLEGIESDAQFVNVIMQAIDNAEIFLFMYSKEHSCIKDYEKDWTVREINYAQAEGKRIVFVNIDQTPLTKWFKFMFGLKQQVDATSSGTFNALLRDLQKWLCVVHPKYQIDKEKTTENRNNTRNIVSSNKLQEKPQETRSHNIAHKSNASPSKTKRPVLYVSIGCVIILLLSIIIGVRLSNKSDQNQLPDRVASTDLDSVQQNVEEPIDSLYYGTKGLEYEYDYKTMTAIVKGEGSAYSESIIIPERVRYEDTVFVVNCIADSAFCKESITSISLPQSITEIGDYAFYDCSSLTSINIPASVIRIGKYAFSGSKISLVDLPTNVQTIGESAFLLVPNVNYLGKAKGKPWGARSVNGYNEDGLIYSDETKKILLACGYDYSNQNLIIPKTVTRIEEDAFFACRNIAHIEMPNCVTSIGKSAFFCCGISSISLSNGLSAIEERTFSCTSLHSVEIPNGVKYIGGEAFFCCRNLEEVKIPYSVERIGPYAFAACGNLKSVSVPLKTKIEKEAFPEKCKITRYCY